MYKLTIIFFLANFKFFTFQIFLYLFMLLMYSFKYGLLPGVSLDFIFWYDFYNYLYLIYMFVIFLFLAFFSVVVLYANLMNFYTITNVLKVCITSYCNNDYFHFFWEALTLFSKFLQIQSNLQIFGFFDLFIQ